MTTEIAYMVLHQVGTAMPGDVVTFSEAQTAMPPKGQGIDVDRLLALQAIRPAAGGEIDHASPFGSGGRAEDLIPFPPVPFEPTTPAPADVDEGQGEPPTAPTVKAAKGKNADTA